MGACAQGAGYFSSAVLGLVVELRATETSSCCQVVVGLADLPSFRYRYGYTYIYRYRYIGIDTVKVCIYKNRKVKHFSFFKYVFVNRLVYCRFVMEYVGISVKQWNMLLLLFIRLIM